MPRVKAQIRIENVVASATLNQRIDLNSVVKSYPGVEYHPEQFPGLVFRLKKPKTATLIFNSGKMVCTGAKSEREARGAVMKVIEELKRSGIVIVGKPELKIQNIVASANLFGMIDLEQLPKPKFLVKNTVPCSSSNMQYQVISVKYNAPLILIDSPYYLNYRGYQYFLEEFKRAISEIENLLGREMDEDVLKRMYNESNKVYEYIQELYELRKNVPNPDPGFLRAFDIALFLLGLGLPDVTEYYKVRVEETKKRAQKGEGVIPPDKEEIRIAWSYII